MNPARPKLHCARLLHSPSALYHKQLASRITLKPYLLEEVIVVGLADLLGAAGPQGLVVILNTPCPHILIVGLHHGLNLQGASSTRAATHHESHSN